MYATRNGWTKKKMKEVILKFNNGTRSYSDGYCHYKNPVDKNRCAVGCFIPNTGFEGAFAVKNDVDGLLEEIPELASYMPLGKSGLNAMQRIHDDEENEGDRRELLCNWIDKNVREGKRHAKAKNSKRG